MLYYFDESEMVRKKPKRNLLISKEFEEIELK